MAKLNVEDYKRFILEKLEEAGTHGLKKDQAEKSNSKAATQAFNELIKERKIVKTKLGSSNIYLAEPFFQPLEIAYEKIEAFARKQELKAFTKGKIEKEIKTFAAVKAKFNEAIDFLVQEKKLLKFKTGSYFSFLSAERVKEALGVPDMESTPSETLPDQKEQEPVEVEQVDYKFRVHEAFDKLTRESGFSAVEIYHLHKKAGVPLDWLKEYILKLRKEQKAEIHFGDWSLSSEEVRSGVIIEDGEKYLLTKLLV